MDTTKKRITFIPHIGRLFINDFQSIVNMVLRKWEGQGSLLFKHHIPAVQLAYRLQDLYHKGLLHVYDVQVDDRKPILGGLLGCGVGNLWWIEGDVLIEELVVSLTDSNYGFGRFAVEEMERMAIMKSCVLILTGSSMFKKTRLITNMYRKKGFEVYGESYLKEVMPNDA